MAKVIPVITDEEERKSSMSRFTSAEVQLDNWQHITHYQYAKNTLISFNNDWHNFLSFCHNIHITPLPATADTVHRFIDEMAKTRKLASLKRYLITISLLHRCHQLADPCAKAEIRLAMQKQQLEKHDDQKTTQAFREEHLEKLLTRFSLSPNIKDIRDVAIWVVMFEAMLKRSELCAIVVDDLQIQDDGSIFIRLHNEFQIELSQGASSVLQRWLEAGDISEGMLFRRIDRHGNIGEDPLNHSSIYRVFRRASDELGLGKSTLFSGQSPRVGAVKDLHHAGVSIPNIQKQGRWKSAAMPAHYAGKQGQFEEEISKYREEKPWDK